MPPHDRLAELERRALRGDARSALEVASRALGTMNESAFLDAYKGQFPCSGASGGFAVADPDWVPTGDNVGMKVDMSRPSSEYRGIGRWYLRGSGQDANLRFLVHVTPDCRLELAQVGVDGVFLHRSQSLSPSRHQAFKDHARAFDLFVSNDLREFMEDAGGLEDFRKATLLEKLRNELRGLERLRAELRKQEEDVAAMAMAFVRESVRAPGRRST